MIELASTILESQKDKRMEDLRLGGLCFHETEELSLAEERLLDVISNSGLD